MLYWRLRKLPASSNPARSTIQSAFPLWRNMSLVMAQVVGRRYDPRIADRFGDRVTDSRPIVALGPLW